MTERLELKDPHKGQSVSITVLPASQLEVITHQRKPSKPHVKNVSASIDRIGFVVPLVVVERDGRYVIIDGQHRFLAGTELGVKEFPVVVVPEDVAVRMMNLNVERHLNIRERAHVCLSIYREYLEQSPDKPEDDPELEDVLEQAHNVTLGLAYEENGRLAGSAFEPILKRCDTFLDGPLSAASETRAQRAQALLEADTLVRAVAAAMKEMGVENDYASAVIVSSVNPLKRTRTQKGFDETFDKLLGKLRELTEDPDKIRKMLGGGQ